MTTSVQEVLETKLAACDPTHLEVVNESGKHNVPKGSETHFKVVMICDKFEGLRLIQRHRMINEILQEELAGPIHALSLHLYTNQDWEKRFGSIPESPPCRGGEKTT
ncbi:MAG: BolA/IbaG family iron-sulfur metabolism protein [Gammaproteobacteria bacterium]|nr:BolA/IbaG family iron-sulfur metabolism protein [Gammaproteobacteria bacterium]MYF02959.1 BolA/IbaG family iron-sulfur metabolism protein [Gammaproteobacteria bacterium]MYI76708.1 BolA/IbaG family iron-sulfur metabolism protein [Gammaproteobacteria bacterium]